MGPEAQRLKWRSRRSSNVRSWKRAGGLRQNTVNETGQARVCEVARAPDAALPKRRWTGWSRRSRMPSFRTVPFCLSLALVGVCIHGQAQADTTQPFLTSCRPPAPRFMQAPGIRPPPGGVPKSEDSASQLRGASTTPPGAATCNALATNTLMTVLRLRIQHLSFIIAAPREEPTGNSLILGHHISRWPSPSISCLRCD